MPSGAGMPWTVLRDSRYMSFRNARRSARGKAPNAPDSAKALRSPPENPTSPSGVTPQAARSRAIASDAE